MSSITAAQAYEHLKEAFSDMAKLGHAKGILSKDEEVFMPTGSGDARADQLQTIDKILHEKIADPRVKDWLDIAESSTNTFSDGDRRNLQLMRHDWIHNASLPKDLAAEVSRVETEGGQLHTENYKSGDWNTMKDIYARAFKVAREVGQAKIAMLGVSSPYEALLDQYSPGMRISMVEKTFGVLDKVLPDMIRDAVERQNKADKQPIPFKGPFSEEKQMILNKMAAATSGFDFTRGRLDAIKGHPSCYGAPNDVRITTRCYEDDFTSSHYSSTHECGHGSYEQNLPKEWEYQPAGSAFGMSVHESQSRIIEVVAGLSTEYIEGWLSKKAAEVFGYQDAFEKDNLRRLLQRVQPSCIRVDADEMTYPMHIIVRYELERAIIEGKLDVTADLPDAFKDGLQKRLGVRPQNNAEGCMQDVHWPTGSVGYFPDYTFGDMIAVQGFKKAVATYPDIAQNLSKGDFTLLNKWRKENIHSKGSLLDMDELILQATGEPLNPTHYINHLSERYLGKPFKP